jgi:hypothetical protein
VSILTMTCGAAIVFGLWLVNRSRAHPAPSTHRVLARAPDLSPPAPAPSPEAG